MVAEDNPQPLAVDRIGNPGLLGDVNEAAVALVEVQAVGQGAVDVGVAIGAQVTPRVTAELVVVPGEVNVVGHIQIKATVVVDVTPRSRGSPLFVIDPDGCADLAEAAVAIAGILPVDVHAIDRTQDLRMIVERRQIDHGNDRDDAAQVRGGEALAQDDGRLQA